MVFILSTHLFVYVYILTLSLIIFTIKIVKIQQARDDLNKKSEWETHKKINEEMERNLEQLKQEKVQLELALDEADRRRNAQV